jgi:hypothetical protein
VHLSLDLLIDADPHVAARWTIRGPHTGSWAGVPPSGRTVAFSGVNIFRFAEGKVVELWNHRDDLGPMEQVGSRIDARAIPAVRGSARSNTAEPPLAPDGPRSDFHASSGWNRRGPRRMRGLSQWSER